MWGPEVRLIELTKSGLTPAEKVLKGDEMNLWKRPKAQRLAGIPARQLTLAGPN